MRRLAALASGRPRLVVACALALAVGGGLYGATAAGRLSSGGFGDDGAESARADDALAVGGHDPNDNLLVVVTPPGPSPFGGLGPVLSRDGRHALYVVRDVSKAEAGRLERLAPPGVELGGPPVVAHQIDRTLRADLRRGELIAFPLVFLLSLLVFGGLVAALLPPLVGAATIAGALLGLRLATDVMTVSEYALNLVTGMGLGLSIDYSLFVVSRYREELARTGACPSGSAVQTRRTDGAAVHPEAATASGGLRGGDALRRTLATAGRTVLFSSATVAGAMAALLVFPVAFLRSMGLGGVLVALVAALVSLVFLPALLALLGARVNAIAPAPLRRAVERRSRPATNGFWYRLARLVMRRPLPIATATAALLVALGIPFFGIRFTTTDARSLPAGTSGYRVARLVQEEFPRSLDPPIRIAVHAGPAARLAPLVQAIRRLRERPDVGAPAYLGASTWRVDVGVRGTSGPAESAVREIRRIPTPFRLDVGGRSAFLVDQKATLAAHLPAALAIVVATTLVALFLMTGSVLLPVKAVLLNLVTLCAVFGVLVLIFQDGHLSGLLGFTSPGALDTTQPILIAAFAFGLSTDYGVFLLTRIKEAVDGGADNEAAVAVGLERTGRIVTAAALLFLVAIGTFASSRLVALKEIGVGTGLAVALDATIVRALLVPALMRLLGRWNWWAPAPLRRLHGRIGWSEQ